jgi:hypothetical protein
MLICPDLVDPDCPTLVKTAVLFESHCRT